MSIQNVLIFSKVGQSGRILIGTSSVVYRENGRRTVEGSGWSKVSNSNPTNIFVHSG